MEANQFVITTLSENPEYFEEVIALIEEEFHYSANHCFEIDFAPLVNPLNFENCYFYLDKETNQVAAHLAISYRTLIKDEHALKIGLIGGIATRKNYKKKNLFRNLMNHVLEISKQEIALYILWSDIEGLYEKFNFYRSGGLIETGKSNFSTSPRPIGFEKTYFPKLSESDFKQITYLYKNFNEQYFFTIKREENDWSIIKEMTSVDLYIKRNAEGLITKYFCVNKGRDLTDIIHEVSALNLNEFKKLLKLISPFKTWLPETEQDKLRNNEFFYTAFYKLGSIHLLNTFLSKISQNEVKIILLNQNQVQFSYKNKLFDASPKDFLQYLFGPKPLDEFTHYRLSLYIAGTDSV